jgi:cytochrome c
MRQGLSTWILGPATLGLGLLVVAGAASVAAAGTYNFGKVPSAAEIAALDIDAMPDGRGLPAGSGTPAQGREIYQARCAACHGANLEGVGAAGGAPLIGGRGSLDSDKPKKTIESYWPYATTIFDYVKRAMPFDAPGSLSDKDVYAVTAYILSRAKIIKENATIDRRSLPKVSMPNRDGFIPDPRPDVRNYQ